MTENMKKFTEAVELDEALVERLRALETAEELTALAKEKGFELTEEDLLSLESQTGELADSELDDVAGGMISFWNMLWNGNRFGSRNLKYSGGAKYTTLGGASTGISQNGAFATKLGGVSTGMSQKGAFATRLGGAITNDDDDTVGNTTKMFWTKV